MAASAKADQSGARPTQPDVQAVLDKVPLMLVDGGGPDDLVVQAAAQPCYLMTGEPPVRDACPADKADGPR